MKNTKQKFILHTPHLARALAVAAAHALFTEDHELSKEVATVIYNYYKLRESIIDQHNERGTKEYIDRYKQGKEELEPWPNDLWRGMHLISGGDNLGMAYDFSATWMNEDQKKLMRRVIKKSVAGKRAYGQNGPLRWRDTNWVGWDLNIIVSAVAIEGEEGYDPEIIKVCNETLSIKCT